MKISWLSKVFNIVFVIAVFTILILKRSEITKFIHQSGDLAPYIATTLLAVLGPTPIATDPILILMAISYGPIVGVIVGTIGNTLAMFFEYFVGYKLQKEYKPKIPKNRLTKWLYQLPIESPWFLLLGRMIPGYGSKVISLIAGSYKINLKLYLWTSFLSALFGAIITSYGGFSIVEYFVK